MLAAQVSAIFPSPMHQKNAYDLLFGSIYSLHRPPHP